MSDLIERDLWNRIAVTQDSDSLKIYFNGGWWDQGSMEDTPVRD